MNKDIIRICQMEDDLKRESYLNFLWVSNAISLKELEKYYLQNLDYKSILFF